jgi:hypothetical protein
MSKPASTEVKKTTKKTQKKSANQAKYYNILFYIEYIRIDLIFFLY